MVANAPAINTRYNNNVGKTSVNNIGTDWVVTTIDGSHFTLVWGFVGQSPDYIFNLFLLLWKIKGFMVITELALALLICAFSGKSDWKIALISIESSRLE